MRHQLLRTSVTFFLSVILIAAFGTTGIAKAPEGYRDVKLGMSKNQVLDLLQKAPGHFSYDDLGVEIGEIIRSDDLFRHATYRFNSDQTLVEIDLEMREVLGRDRVLELYGDQVGLKLSSTQATVAADLIIEVKDNIVSLKRHAEGRTRSAKSGN
jgi:hypothetical protein